ncbi:hypothetical protein LTR78_004295 [Recurvomyces mirabilis]|uniref:Uncharacterized protein n=1 Tax=Recurvomyces mirabilis TaxID=574656 RepID=A0AAE1C2G1_9PEZI|nr:hypothetical protein LTR78_004295 [Recurvomyces mirabilis]KAK5156038.1 hypothetical protein LTS14_005604 [Recurvomyces mirabilis]
MTVPIPLTDEQAYSLLDQSHRPAKRQKVVESSTPQHASDSTDGSLVRKHPLGVRPSGNALTSSENQKRACGYLSSLPDELLMQLLESLFAVDLLRVGSTCRALHAFTRSEELWRALFVEINCSHLFSDVLHRPYFCAHVPLSPFAENIPRQNQVARLDDLSAEDFAETWVNKPFILTSPVKQWPVYKTWSISYLLEKYADVRFRAESVYWPLHTYLSYMSNSHDESPFYLFDRSFAEKMSLIVSTDPDEPGADYWPPTCFGTDLFTLLGPARPDHRWLIVGPERSGSTFHKDPNATSAWNAVLKGKKYWILFPSSPTLPPPPGVFVSEDQSEVTSPLSIAEWLLGFHAEARQTAGCIEGICGEGEVLHVPSGWYHLVLNLEPSIAITQNFVPRQRVGAVLQFLRDQKKSVSGFGNDVLDPYALFVERLREYDEGLLEEGLRELERLGKGKRGKWEELTKAVVRDEADEENGGGFSFGFGGGNDEDED